MPTCRYIFYNNQLDLYPSHSNCTYCPHTHNHDNHLTLYLYEGSCQHCQHWYKDCHNNRLTSFQFEGSCQHIGHKVTAFHYSNNTISIKASQITGNPTVQPVVYANIKENINARLTLKHRETHGCVVSTVATDALVLKHQAISILSTD